jgi:glycosyltransferase 2 family protein
MLDQLKHKILFSIALSAIVFLALSLYADWEALCDALLHFNWVFLPLALLLASLNYGLRFWRWQVYLSRLDIHMSWRESLVVFLAGLILSVTPGKAGELLKSYFIKERLKVPISQSIPAVICERLTDLIALVFLSLAGVYTFEFGLTPLLIAGTVMLCGVAGLSVPQLANGCISVFSRLPVVGKFGDFLSKGYASMARLITVPALAMGIGLGLLAWFAECLAFFLVLKGFGAEVHVVAATFIYSFATLFGAATLLPGGLGTTEGSMVGLLLLIGVLRPDAVGATLVVRLCTLWFAVAIGAYVLLRFSRYFVWAAEPGANRDVLEAEIS